MRSAIEPHRRRPKMSGLLLSLAGIITLLCIVFAVMTLRQRSEYRAYLARTEAATPPWKLRELSVEDCVEVGVEWAMNCPGIASWCFNEAPRRTRACLESADRSAYCGRVADAVERTSFGYGECERLRSAVTGRYAKRAHKKHCAAGFRTVAEHCRQRLRL